MGGGLSNHSDHAKPGRALLVGGTFWLAVCLVLGTMAALYAAPYTVDDAFISARYATRLAHGQGYTFNDGVRSDGVTGPLWLLPLVLAVWLDLPPLVVGKWLGAVAVLLSCGLVLLRLARRSHGPRRVQLAALLLASSAPLWIWAVAGLETGLATLLCTVMLLSLREPRGLAVGLSGAGLLWLRPELTPTVGLALALSVMRSRRQGALATCLVTASALGLFAFRVHMFDHWLPLSAHAKPPLLVHGARYVGDSLVTPSALALTLGLSVALWRAAAEERVFLAAIALHSLAVMLAGGDWMASARLFVPVLPVVCAVAAVGFARLALQTGVLGTLLFAGAVLVRVAHGTGELAGARGSGQLRQERLPHVLEALAHLPSPIALIDIGAIGYYGGHALIDLAGLTEPRIAHSPGGHLAKRFDPAWFRARAPSAIVLHSRERPRVDDAGHLRWFSGYPVERYVLSMPWVLTSYVVRRVIEYDVGYFYVVLVRRPQND